MNGPTVFLVALLTSALTATGTVFVIERFNLITKTPTDTLVPDLKGVTEADARSNAAVAHLALFIAGREPSAEAKPGTVIRQSIQPGQRVPPESSLNVVISEEVPKVPGLVNLTVAEATQRLEQRGFTLQIGATVPDPTVAQGLILNQAPKADSPYAKGGSVTVQVSGGPGEVAVPKVLGFGLEKAKGDLEKLGIKPVVHWVAMAETPTYVVLNQKPSAGEKVKPGTEIHLTVCR